MGDGQGYIFRPFPPQNKIEKLKNLKKDLKKGNEKGRNEENKEKRDKTHVKIP